MVRRRWFSHEPAGSLMSQLSLVLYWVMCRWFSPEPNVAGYYLSHVSLDLSWAMRRWFSIGPPCITESHQSQVYLWFSPEPCVRASLPPWVIILVAPSCKERLHTNGIYDQLRNLLDRVLICAEGASINFPSLLEIVTDGPIHRRTWELICRGAFRLLLAPLLKSLSSLVEWWMNLIIFSAGRICTKKSSHFLHFYELDHTFFLANT